MAEALRLIAHGADDLQVVSALLQDAAVRTADIAYDAASRTLALVGNRYRWEAAARSRARTGLRIGGVLKVQRRGWPAAGDAVLNLLALRADGDSLMFDFSDKASLRLEVECIDVTLEDLSGPWGTRSTPRHEG